VTGGPCAEELACAHRAHRSAVHGHLHLTAGDDVEAVANLALRDDRRTRSGGYRNQRGREPLERAMALEVRGFGLPVKRVSRSIFPDNRFQRALRWLLLLAVPVAIVLRILGWR